MIFLALECSTAHRSVAVARSGLVLAEASVAAGRDAPLLTLVTGVLRDSAVSREAVEGVVVGLGPGSYAGVRASIAVAQGWQLARGVSLLGLGSVEACIHRAWAIGLRGPTAVVVDAQRNECYLAEYDLDGQSPRPVSPLRLASRQEVQGLQTGGVRLVGPDLGACNLSGETVRPDAGALAHLAKDCTAFVASESLEPIYLRPVAFVKARVPTIPSVS